MGGILHCRCVDIVHVNTHCIRVGVQWSNVIDGAHCIFVNTMHRIIINTVHRITINTVHRITINTMHSTSLNTMHSTSLNILHIYTSPSLSSTT